jgi:hypothetical protein
MTAVDILQVMVGGNPKPPVQTIILANGLPHISQTESKDYDDSQEHSPYI